ncbi:hypothetical protein DPMN_054969 [Dreissena polymorpha]|uniref:Uncharacterized protein n=1 Tax=Dreissena polymorpha TaxID=45954 RepID=A0A9D4CRR6_DREPO|nr:hypothetical protein DPMN_054969 [Dreissena polymorpha]
MANLFLVTENPSCDVTPKSPILYPPATDDTFLGQLLERARRDQGESRPQKIFSPVHISL